MEALGRPQKAPSGGFDSEGREFESLRARHSGPEMGTPKPAVLRVKQRRAYAGARFSTPLMRGSFWSASTPRASARRWPRRQPPLSVRMRLRAVPGKRF